MAEAQPPRSGERGHRCSCARQSTEEDLRKHRKVSAFPAHTMKTLLSVIVVVLAGLCASAADLEPLLAQPDQVVMQDDFFKPATCG